MEFGRFGELVGAMKAAKETAVAAAQIDALETYFEVGVESQLFLSCNKFNEHRTPMKYLAGFHAVLLSVSSFGIHVISGS